MRQNFKKKLGPNLHKDGAGHEKSIALRVRFSISSLQAIFKLEIHTAAFQRIHLSPASLWKSPRTARVRPPKFWTLRAAQVPWMFWDLKILGNFSFSSIFCSRNFVKIHDFHENSENSSPWVKPDAHSKFLQRIFWKLSCSKSESSYKTAALQKRQLKTIDKISSTDKKCAKILQKKSIHILIKMAPAIRRVLLFEPDVYNRLYKAFSNLKFMLQLFNQFIFHQHHHENHHAPRTWGRRNFEHCAQCRSLEDFETWKRTEMFPFH